MLPTPSADELEDLHLLAQAYYETNQYRRAIHVLQKVDKLDQNCKYLVAKCKVRFSAALFLPWRQTHGRLPAALVAEFSDFGPFFSK